MYTLMVRKISNLFQDFPIIFRRVIKCWVFIGLISSSVFADPEKELGGFKIEGIHIQGLQKIPKETILNQITVSVGQPFDSTQSHLLIKQLYATGFFDDVKIYRYENTLKISVIERPIIYSIEITGNFSVPQKEIDNLLKTKRLSRGEFFDRSSLETLRASLLAFYNRQGRYAAKINYTIEQEPEGRVIINLKIKEGPSTKISGVRIQGNVAFSEKQLLTAMPMGPHRVWSFLTRGDLYTQERRGAALEALRHFYLDRGYLNFKIDSNQVSLTPDLSNAYWFIKITEGERYTIEDYQIKGANFVASTERATWMTLKPGQSYSRQEVLNTEQVIIESLGELGYMFAKVHTLPKVNEKNKTLRLISYVNPGRLVYIRRIFITGNTTTQDEVLRRLLPQEAAVSSSKNLKESIRRLNYSGLIERLSGVEVQPSQINDDQVDLNIQVQESQNFGQIIAGGGLSSDGIEGNVSFKKINLFGTGNNLAVNGRVSGLSTDCALSYFNPCYTLDGIKRAIDLYYITEESSLPNKDSLGIQLVKDPDAILYSIDKQGAKLHYSIPINATGATYQIGFGIQRMQLHLPEIGKRSNEMQQFEDFHGDRFTQGLLQTGWERSNLDRFWFPTLGTRFSTMKQLNFSFPSFPSSFKPWLYGKYRCDVISYLPLTSHSDLDQNWILQWHGTIGRGSLIYGKGHYPFFDRYTAGGLGSNGVVRGYVSGALGPMDSLGKRLGGDLLVSFGAALIFPNPIERARTSVFIDLGNVYLWEEVRNNLLWCTQDLRCSVGIGLECLVPVLNIPVSFSFAKPLNARPGDKLQAFQFKLGFSF